MTEQEKIIETMFKVILTDIEDMISSTDDEYIQEMLMNQRDNIDRLKEAVQEMNKK